MKKLLLICFCCLAASSVGFAQPAVPDKISVMEYFQNQQFEEAIRYLTPAVAIDSNNLTWLGLWAMPIT